MTTPAMASAESGRPDAELRDKLPLRYWTPASWARAVLAAPLALLNDHAFLEKKAAANALTLLHRWPDPAPPQRWVEQLTAIARDEVEHLAIVTRLIARRGGQLEKFHRNVYAGDLRQLVRLGLGAREIMDRLMVSALIEARSCERFALLAAAAEEAELARLYGGLWRSEHGHYHVFIELARQLPGLADAEVETRWAEMLAVEAEIIARQPSGPRMHSGLAEVTPG
jgi:tRNA 2-(methylsulfanyl)-N6-isopentenyladenosine37 hydroxylase